MAATTDRSLLARAIVLAERGRATVRPNPVVGCVLAHGETIVGEGWHETAGGPHAEVVALRAAGPRAAGATAYVSLEPCDHQGRTGPCSRALLDAGVRRVVFAAADPAHGGARTLAHGGVEVEGGVLGAWAEAQNEAFLHAVRTGRPFVTLKLAQTLDGALAVPGRRWLTGPEARRVVHRQRGWHDTVLVGSGTVMSDDPRLDVRHVAPACGQPRPVVLDARGRIPVDARVVTGGGLVFTSANSDDGWRAAVESAGAEVAVVATGSGGGLDLPEVLGALAARDVRSVYVEGGGTVAHAFARERLVDRLVLHVALDLIGPAGVPRRTPYVEPPAGAGWIWATELSHHVGADLELVATPQEAA